MSSVINMFGRKKNRKSTQSVEDETFKFFIHKSDVLARLLMDNVDELAGMSVEEIKGCLQLGADGDTVIGKETEYSVRKNDKVILDSVFDVHIPGTEKEISLVVGIEGQNNPRPGYPLEKRAEYYLARMVSAQKGRDFDGKNYGGLRKTYSIWCVLDPLADERNTVYKYKMKGETTFGDTGKEPRPMDTFNVIFINLGRYADNLPDSLAIGTAMFSKMDIDERKELVKKKFNIELDDKELGRLEEMSTLGEDKYEHGKTDGIEIGIDMTVGTIVSYVRDTGISVDEALTRSQIPDEYREEVEKEVRKRLS